MKSLVEEASSVFKAIEKAWDRAGKPHEFSVKIFEESKKNFFGLTTKSAKVGIFFDERAITKQPKKETRPATEPAKKHVPQKVAPRRQEQNRQEPRQRQERRQRRPQDQRQQERRPQRDQRDSVSTERREKPTHRQIERPAPAIPKPQPPQRKEEERPLRVGEYRPQMWKKPEEDKKTEQPLRAGEYRPQTQDKDNKKNE